ncbi:MAG: HAD family hydrolase [Chthonomonadales bacterium]
MVCDLGQVLLRFDFSGRDRMLRARCAQCTTDPVDTLLHLHEQMGLTQGRSTGEEFFQQFTAATGMRLSYEEFESIYCNRFWEDPVVTGLIARIPSATRILLTNTDDVHLRWIRRHYPQVIALFHHVVASCEVGMSKPDEAIFRHVEHLTGCAPAEHLFIDDVEAYVQAARERGWRAVVHEGAEPLARELASAGLLA